MLKDVATETSKMSFFRTPFGNARVNGFQTLLKSAGHRYFSLFSWIRGKLSWKKFALVSSEIFRPFLNTLTAGDKYSRSNIQTLFSREFEVNWVGKSLL